jgi:hypothetical protein
MGHSARLAATARGNGQVVDPRRCVGDALPWADGPVRYRLQSTVGRERTIELAESVP